MKKIMIIAALLLLLGTAAFAVNILSYGDMESGTASLWVEEGSSLKLVKGEGINGSTALLVKNTETWSGTGIDVTKWYDLKKSYYVEVWFKLYKSDNSTRKGSITMELQPEGTEEWTEYYYLDVSTDYDGKECTGSEQEFTNAEYVKVSGVYWGSDLQFMLEDDPRKITHITIYFKMDEPKARRYYIDNVVIEEIPEPVV